MECNNMRITLKGLEYLLGKFHNEKKIYNAAKVAYEITPSYKFNSR